MRKRNLIATVAAVVMMSVNAFAMCMPSPNPNAGNDFAYYLSQLNELTNANETTESTLYVTPQTLNTTLATLDDSESKIYNIHLASGTYSPITFNDREHYVNLIGDEEGVEIVSESGTYANPAAELRLNGTVKNITFINRHPLGVVVPRGEKGGYAVHLDYGSQDTTFENCKFISYQAAAIGAGIDSNSSLTFKNCYIANKSTEEYSYHRNGAIYAHTGIGEVRAIGGDLKVINCNLEAPADAWSTIVTDSLNGSKLRVYRA